MASLMAAAPGEKRSLSEEGRKHGGRVRDFENALLKHRYPGLTTNLEVFAGEDHASVFPFLLTHGLRSYLKTVR